MEFFFAKLFTILSTLVLAFTSFFGTYILGLPESTPSVIPVSTTDVTTMRLNEPEASTTPTTVMATSGPSTTMPQKNVATKKEPQPKPVAIVQPAETINLKEIDVPVVPQQVNINDAARAALVNILCITKSSGTVSPITGSGIFIDPRGILLTNAHIGQYLLLKDLYVKDFIQCYARQGSPAKALYRLEPVFISDRWIRENYRAIAMERPLGTGEHDFALLRVSEALPGVELPKNFPFLNPAPKLSEAMIKSPVLLAGYPAGFLGGETITKELYAVSTVTTIQELFTFHDNTLDLIAVGGTIASQQGSSGGAVVSQADGSLIGIIATATDGSETSVRDLRAITTEHISRSLSLQTGMDLRTYLSGDIQARAESFMLYTAPELTMLLKSALQ